MPIVALEIPQTYENITRPITMSVGRDLMKALDIPEGSSINHLGTIDRVATQEAVVGDNRNPDPRFPFNSRVQLRAREIQQEDTEHSITVKQVNQPSVFADADLNVYLKPVYVRCEVQVEFNYRAASRNEAYQFLDHIRRKTAERRQQFLHEIKYHYPIPFAFMDILQEIHRLRENVAPYDEEMGTWFQRCFTDRLTVVSNLAGAQRVAAISERQIAIQGWFNMRDVEPEQEQDGGPWVVQFPYIFRYDRVSAMTMQYPIIVHNQLLSSRYVNRQGPYVPEDLNRLTSLSQAAYDRFSGHKPFESDNEFGIRVPMHDDFKLKNVSHRVINTFQALFGANPDEPHDGPNITNLEPCDIAEPILAFIQSTGNKVFQYRRNIFHMNVARNEFLVDGSTLSLDTDGTIVSTETFNPRHEHRLFFGVFWDLRNLDRDAWEDLKNNPDIWHRVVDYLDRYFNPPKFSAVDHAQHPDRTPEHTNRPPWLWDERTGYYPGPGWWEGDWRQRPPWWDGAFTPGNPPWIDLIEVGTDGRVTDPSIDDIVNRIPPGVDIGKVGKGRSMWTVGYTTIIAHPIKHYR